MFLEYVEPEEHHQAVHEYPEDGKRHSLAHDVAVLALHVAGGGGNGNALRREQLTTLATGTVGGGQPVGLASADTEEGALVDESEVAGGGGLQLAEQDVGVGGTTGDKRSDGADERREEREEGAGEGHEALGNVVGHSGVVHQHGHGHEAADGDGGLLQVDGGLGEQLHQAAEREALDESADGGAEEYHESGIGEPAELEGVADDGQLELGDEALVEQLVDGGHNLAGDEDEEDDEAIDAPCLQGLAGAEDFLLDLHFVGRVFVADEQLVVDEHGDDGCHGAEDGGRRCPRTGPARCS